MATINPINYPLSQPSWEQQEGESNKEYHLFRLFCAHGGSIIKFHGEIKGRKRGDFFYEEKIKYVPPTSYGTYLDLSSARYWFERRSAEEKDDEDFLRIQYKKIDRRKCIEKYEQKDRVEGKIWDRLENRLDGDEINGTQTKDFVAAANGVQDSKAKDKGEDVQKIKAELEADVDAKADVKTDFQRDLEKFQEKIISGDLSKRVQGKIEKQGQ